MMPLVRQHMLQIDHHQVPLVAPYKHSCRMPPVASDETTAMFMTRFLDDSRVCVVFYGSPIGYLALVCPPKKL